MSYKTIILLTILLAIFLISCTSKNYDDFAQCLSDKGAKMYGAYWCQYCQTQESMFGNSFEFVNYVECSLPNAAGETESCRQANIESYPTWEFADGKRIEGVIEFKELARITGCSLEQEKA